MTRNILALMLLICSTALAAAPATRPADAKACDALLRAGMKLLRDGDYLAAATQFEQAADMAESLDDNHQAAAATNRALTYKKLARFDDAEKQYRKAIDLFRANGRRPLDLAVTLDNFGNLYDEQKRLADGEPLHRQALVLFEKSLPPDDLDVLTCRANLAESLQQQGKFAEAVPLYQKSIADLEKKPDAQSQLAISLDNYAGLLVRQGKLDESLVVRQRALKLFEQTLGPDHPEVAITLDNIAGTYLHQGNAKDAEPLLRRSLKIQEKAFGEDNPVLAKVLDQLARALEQLKRTEEAKPIADRAKSLSAKN